MKTTILTLALLLASQLLNAQTRGTSPGELYFSTTWYYEAEGQYDMIIHSTNNGKNFKPTYVYKHDSGKTPVGNVMADATPGILYMTSNSQLHISYDSTKSWEFVENIPAYFNNYSTGVTEGEIYKNVSNYDSMRIELFRSDNYGDGYTLTHTHIGGFVEVGVNSGEVYYYMGPDGDDFPLQIFFSDNSGNLFLKMSEHSFLSDTAGGIISGHHPIVTRGYNSGELYLVSWHLPANYKIFRSTNYGESFTLQYEQPDTCDFFYEGFSFTAGRSPGEFYIFKSLPWYDGTNTKLHVYYSSDYAKTFTEYVHVFDKNWTNINEQLVMSNGQLKNYPNPFTKTTTISYSGNQILNKPIIEIININGQLIETLPLKGNSMEWNSGNNKTGIYFYRIKADNYISKTNTMMKIQ